MQVDPAPRHIAYLSLQAVADGQDTWAAVTEIIGGWESGGWRVDRFFPDYRGGIAPGGLARLVEMWRVQRRLARRLGDYDAIYIRAHQMAWPLARAAARRGIPVVQECNGPYEDLFIAWPSTRIARPLFEYLQRSQYRRASAIVSVAEGLTDWLVTDTGNEHVVTNGNGANTVVFTPDAPRRQGLPARFAVFFGQFPAWQGISTLLQATRLPSWPDDLPLVFVGDGAERVAIEAAASEMPSRVMYLGPLPYVEVSGVVAHALVSFVPMAAPERENKFSPLKLYESMACGVPVVASDVVGISEIVHECGCGLLVPPGDPEALARATRRLSEDPGLAAAMGGHGRTAAVDQYSWRARSSQRRSIIEDAITRSVAGRQA